MNIDLSVVVNEQTPIYPGDPATKIKPVGVMSQDGFNDHFLSMGTHVGTHIDAPLHMLAGGKTLDQFPVDQFIGRGRVIEVKDGTFDLEAIKQTAIQAGDIVLFNTGMSVHYHEPIYFEKYPAMSEEVANYLVEQKVKMVGVDNCSVDNLDGFPIHKILLDSDILIVENLTNLHKLVGKEFTIYALPLKLQVDGAPARVVAAITNEEDKP